MCTGDVPTNCRGGWSQEEGWQDAGASRGPQAPQMLVAGLHANWGQLNQTTDDVHLVGTPEVLMREVYRGLPWPLFDPHSQPAPPSHCADEETRSQRGQVTCPRSHDQALKPCLFDPKAGAPSIPVDIQSGLEYFQLHGTHYCFESTFIISGRGGGGVFLSLSLNRTANFSHVFLFCPLRPAEGLFLSLSLYIYVYTHTHTHTHTHTSIYESLCYIPETSTIL